MIDHAFLNLDFDSGESKEGTDNEISTIDVANVVFLENKTTVIYVSLCYTIIYIPVKFISSNDNEHKQQNAKCAEADSH